MLNLTSFFNPVTSKLPRNQRPGGENSDTWNPNQADKARARQELQVWFDEGISGGE